ncbi:MULTISPECIES: VOC family protein [unclassified Agarivorans]|uniref:VOC family protein n=1 Tax=unclassified Agarivorans TaxID=2636026 RepID=UPI0026E45616|nr:MULTISPECIES: VOC family protein [unclassified Agarivorans]MDO6686719.1 VOC family protein [Agarivorans sp. 3_MG-2023]MDO6716551.1 VOC family protein [Agarivorans sp. 2_MG-2023]
MYLEHINLTVKDMDQTLVFYKAAFPHWWVRGKGQQTWYGTDRRWLHFGDDNHYLAFNDNGYGENRPLEGNQLGVAHYGYVTANLDAVISRLLAAGFEIHHEGAQSAHRRNVYFRDPNGFEVEFVEYSSDLPKERNLYE